MRTAVVLPAPFGPRTPRTVPASTVRSMPRSASTGAPLPRLAANVLRNASTVIACCPTPPTLKEKPGPKPGLFSANRSGVGDLALALVVAPGRLDGERAGRQRDVLRLAGA